MGAVSDETLGAAPRRCRRHRGRACGEFADPDHALGLLYSKNEHETGAEWVILQMLYWDNYERIDGRWLFRRRSTNRRCRFPATPPPSRLPRTIPVTPRIISCLGRYGSVNVGNTCRQLSFFVMVLCHSRLMCVEFTVPQTMEHFLGCHPNAFEALGGVPAKIVVDNPKSAVGNRRHIRRRGVRAKRTCDW